MFSRPPRGSSGTGQMVLSQKPWLLGRHGCSLMPVPNKNEIKKCSNPPEEAYPYAQGPAHSSGQGTTFRWVSIPLIPVTLTLCRILRLRSFPPLNKIEEHLFSSPGRRHRHVHSIADFHLYYTERLWGGLTQV